MPPKKPEKATKVVDANGIAKMADVNTATVYAWRSRNILPDPAMKISARKLLWDYAEVVDWLVKTNRMPAKNIEIVEV